MATGERITFELRAGGCAEPELAVEHVEGQEGLSAPYAFEVGFVPVSGEPVDLEALAGAEAVLAIVRPGGAQRIVHGECVRAELTGVAAGVPRYRLRIGPRLLRLGHARRSRIFQGKSAPQIVGEVLDAHGVAWRSALSGSYPAREYVAQFRETDLAFVSRLLEGEGIWYRFEHVEGGHTLELGDGAGGLAEGGDPVPLREHGQGEGVDHVFRLERDRRVVSGAATRREYDFERPGLDLTASAGQGELEVYEYPGGHGGVAEGKRLAQARLEDLGYGAEEVHGKGTSLAFVPGAKVEVEGEGTFAVVRVVHRGEQQGSSGALGGMAATYENGFEAIDAARPYRPRRRTPWPRMVGIQTATVVGPAGEEVHLDRHGRVKVQFHWDRDGKRDDRSSCWVRVAQAWAGVGLGAAFVPRVGQGDRARPLVTGAVFNGANVVPLALPGDKTRSTLRTDSSPGSGGSNELRFEDLKDGEEVYLHAQKDLNAVVENDASAEVRANATLEVTKDRTRAVHGRQEEHVDLLDQGRVDGSQTLTVLVDRTTGVVGSHQEEVGGSQAITVARQRDITTALASMDFVGAAAALNVGAAYAVTVGAACNIAVGGLHSREVVGAAIEVVGASRDETVAKDRSSRTGGGAAIEVEGRMEQLAGEDDKADVGGSVKAKLTAGGERLGTVNVLGRTIELRADRLTIAVNRKVALRVERSGAVKLYASSVSVDGRTIALKGVSGVLKKQKGSAERAATSKVDESKLPPPKITKIRWSKDEVEPLHNSGFPPAKPPMDVIPGACKVVPTAETQNVPDGTKAVITIHHCASGAMVKGGKLSCVVQGGKLVDEKSKKPPEFTFGAEQTPWDPYDQPFFFFRVQIGEKGLKGETPSDPKDEKQVLRVLWYHVCVSDFLADNPPTGNGLTTVDEMNEIAGLLGARPHHHAGKTVWKLTSAKPAVWGSVLRNSYAYHQASHGDVVNRLTGAQLSTAGNPPAAAPGSWRSVVVLGHSNFGDKEVGHKKVPSVPRYLVYMNTCVAAWEPSLGQAFVTRGTHSYIGFRKYIPDDSAREMARQFHASWAGVHACNPEKIKDVFQAVAPKFYGSMRPVLVSAAGYSPIAAPAPPGGKPAPSKPPPAAPKTLGTMFKTFVGDVTSLFK